MKLQIDTKAKTIKIDESVNFGELMDSVKKLLPKGAWIEYRIEPTVIKEWISPVIINPAPMYPIQPNPFTPLPPWTVVGSSADNNLAGIQSDFIHNIEIDYSND